MREKVRDIGSARSPGSNSNTGSNSNRSVRSDSSPRGFPPRRLAAIVAGDIAGYSRLMELDEEGTHVRVKRIQRDLIEPSIREHYGRLVKTTGDGFIAIFDSPVEAVRCAIVIQQNMSARNMPLPRSHWIEYRIGVNLGDVMIEEDDIYGDGVNVASRLEGLAQPGQVYISGGIYEQIKNKLVCGYESLGDRKVKNITDPVRVYRVLPDPTALNTRRRRETASRTSISARRIIPTSRTSFVQATPTSPMRPNTACAIIAAAGARPHARPRCGSPQARSRARSCPR